MRAWLKRTLGIGLALLLLLGALQALGIPARVLRWSRTGIVEKLGTGQKPPDAPALRTAAAESFVPLGTAAGPPGVAETPIRLLEGTLTAEPPRQIARQNVSIDGRHRNVVAAKVPYAFAAQLRVPQGGELWLALNHEAAGLDAAGVEFRLYVRANGGRTLVFDHVHSSLKTEWLEARVDLSAWAGRDIELGFETVHAGAVDGWAPRKPIKAFWGDLFVRSRAPAERRPNVILILLDTLRPDHLGAYGYNRPTSPNIDALAAEGVRFSNAFSSAPWTDPSVLSLLTGMYPSDLWEAAPYAKTIRKSLSRTATTLAEVFASAGYFTIAASDHPAINSRRFGEGFDVFADLYHADGPYSWRKTEPRKVLDQLDHLLERRTGGGLFAYIHVLYPHVPYAPPAEYLDLLGPRPPGLPAGKRIDRYDAEIRQTDDAVGFVRRLLSAHALAEDEIIVIASDHGEAFGEHGLEEHGNSLYNELLRVVLILHAPGRLPGGTVVTEPVQLIDIFPTLLDLARIAGPVGLRGISLRQLVGGRGGRERAIYSEFPDSRIVPAYSIQSRFLKLIVPEDRASKVERYDLGRDPAERTSLGEGEVPGEAALMQEAHAIRRRAQELRAHQGSEQEEPSEAMLERLHALGYVK